MHVCRAVGEIMDHGHHYVGLQAANRVLGAHRFVGQQTESDAGHFLSDVPLDHRDGILVSYSALRDEFLGAVEIWAISSVVAETVLLVENYVEEGREGRTRGFIEPN